MSSSTRRPRRRRHDRLHDGLEAVDVGHPAGRDAPVADQGQGQAAAAAGRHRPAARHGRAPPGTTTPKVLFDNTSTTSTAFADDDPDGDVHPLGCGSAGDLLHADQRARPAGAPSAWRLEGSKDGRGWTGARPAQRPGVPVGAPRRGRSRSRRPARTRPYRLVVTASDGAPRLSRGGAPHRRHQGGERRPAASRPVTGSRASRTCRCRARSRPSRATPASTTADYTATIDWGDGTSSAGTIRAGDLGSYTVRASHTYAKPGPYEPVVTVSGRKQRASAVGEAVVHQARGPGLRQRVRPHLHR